MKTRFVVLIAFILAATGFQPQAQPARSAKPAQPQNAAPGRLDGLVVGVPGETVNGFSFAGQISLLPGTVASGLRGAGNTIWDQSMPGILDDEEGYDTFGSSLAVGDFNGDAFYDLAVGIPGEVLGFGPGIAQAGAVSVLYNTAHGLDAEGNQFWHQDSPGIDGVAEYGDEFGASLASGDFNGDGYTDLAIGVPREDLGNPGVRDGGAAHVLYGSSIGLTATGSQLWYQDGSPGGLGHSELSRHFGSSLSSGDFNGDDYADLAIGVPLEHFDLGTGTLVQGAGVVNLLLGSPSGLYIAGDPIWHQGKLGLADDVESGDTFGFSLASGDFNGDDYADLAVGVLWEDIDPGTGTPIADVGAVNLIYGGSSGLTAAGSQLWHQDVPNIADDAEVNDRFGYSLAAGDFDGDGYTDLAIGVSSEDLDPGTGMQVEDAGVVNLIYGGPSGLTAAGSQLWHQDVLTIADNVEQYDQFGSDLAAGDFDGDGYTDLAVGVSSEAIDPGTGAQIWAAGAVNLLYGGASGLSSDENQFWSQASPSILGEPEIVNFFGSALAALPMKLPSLFLPVVIR